jgi:tetratricopeptide (TPR) repeat protein
MVAWGAWAVARRFKAARVCIAVGSVLAIVVLAALARDQVSRWRNSETLFRHTLAVAGESLLRTNLGGALIELERWEDALREYDIALSTTPNDMVAWFNVGIAAGKLRRWEEAEEAFRTVVEADPSDLKALFNLGNCLAKQQRWDEALAAYRAVILRNPADAEARFNVGMIAVILGDRDTAEDQLSALAGFDKRLAENLRQIMTRREW